MKNYIVFDLEWNQSPQGKEGSIENFPFEIIEIGAVRLDESFRVLEEFHRLVKPQVYKEMHFMISEVTHMDIRELKEQGEDFTCAVQEFLDWCKDEPIFCTWGPMDLTELQRNMVYYGMELPFHLPLYYYDIQKLYSLKCGYGKTKVSLDTAVEEMGIMEERPFHRALDDAYYTGKVMAHMDFLELEPYISLDYYRVPQSKEEEIYLVFPDYSKYVSRTFESKEEALEDKAVTDMICYQCRRMLRKKVRWFSVNQKVYFCLAVCPEHGFLRGKIRMKKTDDDRVYAVKTIKIVREEGAQQVIEKREEVRKKRNMKNRLSKIRKKQL